MTDPLDVTTKYVKIASAFCMLLTILCGCLCFYIGSVVTQQISPLQMDLASAEEKLKEHIISADKYMENITEKKIFDLTIKNINEDIAEIKISQARVSLKLDDLIKLILKQKSIRETPKPDSTDP